MKKRILHIDDEKAILESTRLIFQDLYEIDTELIGTESDADRAEEKAATNEYSVILLGVIMPRNGIEVLKNIKAKGVKTPIYMYSGSGGKWEREALKHGAKGYIRIPCSIEEVREIVAKETQ